jgi:hypothetical protein
MKCYYDVSDTDTSTKMAPIMQQIMVLPPMPIIKSTDMLATNTPMR